MNLPILLEIRKLSDRFKIGLHIKILTLSESNTTQGFLILQQEDFFALLVNLNKFLS